MTQLEKALTATPSWKIPVDKRNNLITQLDTYDKAIIYQATVDVLCYSREYTAIINLLTSILNQAEKIKASQSSTK